MSKEARPFAIVAAVGLTLAILQYVLDSRQPLVFSVPILVLTGVILLVMWLARRAPGDLDRLAEETGLRDGGVAPLPTVTPILAGVREPTRVLTGRLPNRGPRVRVARVRDRLVAISETAATALDEETADALVLHPLRPEAGVEDGLLVVAVPRDTGGRELLDLVAETEARLTSA